MSKPACSWGRAISVRWDGDKPPSITCRLASLLGGDTPIIPMILTGMTGPFARTLGQRGNAHGPPIAPTAFEKIAVLPVHGGMLYARKQQPVAVETAVLRVVLKQALSDLLVVRVVAEATGGQRQLLHQRLAVAAAREIRLGPGDGLGSIERDDGGQGAFQELQLAHPLGAG